MWRVRQGSSLTWLSIRIRLQGRKPEESNKLFDLFLPITGHPSVPSVQSVLEKEPQALRCLEEPELFKAIIYALTESPCMLRRLEDGNLDMSNKQYLRAADTL